MYSENPGRLLNAFKRGALLTVEYNPKGTDHWLTVFARVGRRLSLWMRLS